MLLALLLAPAAAAEPCGVGTRSALLAAVSDAEQAFLDARPEGIQEAALRARGLLPCTGVRVLPEEAGAIHRLFAYDAFVARNQDAARRWLEASRAADPAYAIPTRVLPARHPLRRLFEEATPRERTQEAVSTPRGVELWVDGRLAEAVPMGRPALVQAVSVDGVQTWLQAEGGAPEALQAPPTPSSDGGSASVAVGASGSWLAADSAQVYGGPQARIHVPLAGVLHGEGMVAMPLTVADDGTGQAVYGLPAAQLGLVARVPRNVTPWAGAGAVLLFDADAPLVGGAASVGLDVPAGPVAIAPEMRLGWAGVPLVSVGVGVAFGG